MRPNKMSVWGSISDQGVLDCYKGEIEAFLHSHPGRNAILRIELAPREPSAKMRAYYYNYVLPRVNMALYDSGMRMNQFEADKFLREQCPTIREETWEDGKYKVRVKSFDALDSAEAMEYLDWLKEYASENLFTIIDDP